MLTKKSLKEYSEILVKAIGTYSEETVLETQKHLKSDEKVTRVHQIIIQEPELLYTGCWRTTFRRKKNFYSR